MCKSFVSVVRSPVVGKIPYKLCKNIHNKITQEIKNKITSDYTLCEYIKMLFFLTINKIIKYDARQSLMWKLLSL